MCPNTILRPGCRSNRPLAMRRSDRRVRVQPFVAFSAPCALGKADQSEYVAEPEPVPQQSLHGRMTGSFHSRSDNAPPLPGFTPSEFTRKRGV